MYSRVSFFFQYFKIFREYLGNKIYIFLFLALTSSFLEGIGIAMFFPLLSALGVDSTSSGRSSSTLESGIFEVFSYFDLDYSLNSILLLIFLIFTAKGIFSFLLESYSVIVIAFLAQRLRIEIVRGISQADFPYFSRRNSGYFVNVIQNQVGELLGAFKNFTKFISLLLSAVLYVSLVFLTSLSFGLVAICAAIIISLAFKSLNHFVAQLSHRNSYEHSVFSNLLIQFFGALKYLKAVNRSGVMDRKIHHSLRDLTSFRWKTGVLSGLTVTLQEPLAIGILVLLIIFQMEVIGDPIDSILVMVLVLYRALGSMFSAQHAWQSVVGLSGGVSMVEMELSNLRLQQTSQSTNESVDDFKFENGVTIGIENVWFEFEGASRNLFEDLSMKIPARQSVGLIGESGVGKSTLVDLVCGLYIPKRGRITINGVPLGEAGMSAWRSQVGYIVQDPVLFSGTISENVSLWDASIPDQDVEAKVHACLMRVGLDKFVESLPKGVNTNVGDDGVALSGGQKQRLSIARELYRTPKLIIFDEATSALDYMSERQIVDMIHALKGVVTVIVIAHRYSTLEALDAIYRLRAPGIIESISVEQLHAQRNLNLLEGLGGDSLDQGENGHDAE